MNHLLAAIPVLLAGLLCGCSGGAENRGDKLTYDRISFADFHGVDQTSLMAWHGSVLGLSQQGGNWFGLADYSSVEIFDDGGESATPKGPSEQAMIVTLRVPDLDARVALLDSAGASILGPVETDGTIRRIALMDSAGNQLLLEENGPATPGLTFLGIPAARLFVADLETTAAWYETVLELELESMDATSAAFRLSQGGSLELVPGGTAVPSGKSEAIQSVGISLEVPDLDSTIEVLEARDVDVSFVSEFESGTWPDERWVGLRDPEGNEFSIKEVTDD